MHKSIPTQAVAGAKRRARPVLLFAVVSTLAWLTMAALFPQQTETLMIAKAVVGNVEQTVLASGTLKPVKLVAVGAQVSGRVTALKVNLGQTIKTGDLIAEIDAHAAECLAYRAGRLAEHARPARGKGSNAC